MSVKTNLKNSKAKCKSIVDQNINISENPNDPVEIGPEFKKNVRELCKQQKIHFTTLASACGVTDSKIRNILRLDKDYKQIDNRTLLRIAECLGCTPDYLRSKSKDPNKDANGKLIKSTISFKKRDDKLTHILEYLLDSEHNNELEQIYFLLCEYPEDLRKELFGILNNIFSLIKTCSFYDLLKKDRDYIKKLRILRNNISSSKDAFPEYLELYSEARYAHQRKQYPQALYFYFQFLLKGLEEGVNLHLSYIFNDAIKSTKCILSIKGEVTDLDEDLKKDIKDVLSKSKNENYFLIYYTAKQGEIGREDYKKYTELLKQASSILKEQYKIKPLN